MHKTGGSSAGLFDTSSVSAIQIEKELLSVTNFVDENSLCHKFQIHKEQVKKKIKSLENIIKEDYPKFMRSKKFKEFDKYIKKSKARYLLRYDRVKFISPIFRKEEIYHINKSLDEFLNDINQSSSIQDSLVKKLYEVDEMYRKSIEENIKMKNSISEDLYSISFNLLKEGFDDFENPIYGRLNKLKEHYSTEIQENNLKRLDKEIEKLKNAIDEIFEIKSKIKDVKSTQENIDLNNKIPIKYFPKNNVKNEIEKLNKRKTENKKKLRKFSKNDWLNWDYKTY
jgi:hypothetical protein